MNKRRIFGIISVIVIGLLAFAFANPNNTADNTNDKKEVITTDLSSAKTAAIDELKNYVSKDNYSENNYAIIETIIESGINNINSATTKDEIATALSDAKALIDNVSTSEEDFAKAKAQAINEISNYVLQANYSVNNWTLVQAEINKAVALINAANSVNGVNGELLKGKTAIDAISTLEEDLANAKIAAINELNNYVKETDYSVNNYVLVQTEIAKGVAAINASTTIENVALELAKAKTAIDAISTLEEDLANAKVQAINEISNYIKDINLYRIAEQQLIKNIINNGIIDINKIKNIDLINPLVQTIKEKLDQIKTDKILSDEEALAARVLALKDLEEVIKEAESKNIDDYSLTTYNELINYVNETKLIDLDSKTTQDLIDITNEIRNRIDNLSGIEFDYITLNSTNKIYYRGEDAEQIIATAHYKDSNFTKTVSASFDKEINTNVVVNNEEVTFTYMSSTVIYTYSVIRNEEDQKLDSITASLDKSIYELGSNIYTLTVVSKDVDGTLETVNNYVITKQFNTSKIGEYEIEISYTKGDITKTTIVKYSVVDTTKPVVTLKGLDNIILTRYTYWFNLKVDYEDAGVVVSDLDSTNIQIKTIYTAPYSKTGTAYNNVYIDTKVGTYTIIYTVSDLSGNKTEITRTVKVRRSFDTSDDIKFDNVNNSSLEVCKNCNFVDDKNVKASDLFDDVWFHSEPLTVTSTNNVDMTKLGEYAVYYSATDWLGNTKTVSRKVNVVDTTKPVITLLNTTTKVNYNSKTSLNIKNYTITDNYYNNLVAKISYDTNSETNYICTKKLGSVCIWGYFETKKYITDVIYETVDGSGNKSTNSYKLDNRVLINE